jgi:hypothetical protein
METRPTYGTVISEIMKKPNSRREKYKKGVRKEVEMNPWHRQGSARKKMAPNECYKHIPFQDHQSVSQLALDQIRKTSTYLDRDD